MDLQDIYFSPKHVGSLGGVERLFNAAKAEGLDELKRDDVVRFLQAQEAYTEHKPARRRFKRNRILAFHIDGPSAQNISRHCTTKPNTAF